MDFTAHIRESDGMEQSVTEHCRNVAALAESYGESVGLGKLARLQGIFHDAGKLNRDFYAYIHGDSRFHRGEIDHCYAGAKYLCAFSDRHFPDQEMPYRTSRLIARTILSHHGLHDWLTESGDDYFRIRNAKVERYEEIEPNLDAMLAEMGYSEASLKALLEDASEEFAAVYRRIKELRSENRKAFDAGNKAEKQNRRTEFTFYLGMLERLLQSILMDADCVDTADFMNDCQTEKHYDAAQVWERMELAMQRKLDGFSGRTDAISRQRQDISRRCAEFAAHPVGICRLIVPTGGGKTLSSLRFAIRYAMRPENGIEKIVCTAPFMSILEQNSQDFREISGAENFLEHHSNVVFDDSEEGEEELRKYELRTEKWDVPVLATTQVQFLQALFDGKNTSVRRMHRLCRAVLLIDEVQSVPLKCTYLFNLAMNFLSRICGCAVVLCSATQPLLEKQKYPILLDAQESMTGDYHEDFSVFQRTKLEYLTDSYDNAQAADFCWEQFKVHRSVLMVVNTRKTAADLYRRLKERVEDGEENVHLIHLSTNMCPAHRENAIREMRKYLQDGESVICVTTQLIEAGVDISFGCVVRSKAGLSNVAQAAGRCNRHGEMRKICPVYLMKLTEENIDRLKEIVSAQNVTSAVWDSLCMQQKEKETDLLSVETLSQYFQKLYQENQKELSFPQSENDQDLLKLLSTDSKRAELGKGNRSKYDKFSLQAFATAGKAFHVIEDAGESVIVPYDEDAGQMIRDLNGDLEFGQMQKLLRSVQKYTVSVYAGDKRKLAEAGALCPLHCGALALEENFYDKTALGLLTEGQERPFLDL